MNFGIFLIKVRIWSVWLNSEKILSFSWKNKNWRWSKLKKLLFLRFRLYKIWYLLLVGYCLLCLFLVFFGIFVVKIRWLNCKISSCNSLMRLKIVFLLLLGMICVSWLLFFGVLLKRLIICCVKKILLCWKDWG